MSEELESGVQLGVYVGNEESRATRNGFGDFWKREIDGVEEEIEDRVDVGVRIGGEELKEHVEDASDGGVAESDGGEALCDGLDGGDWDCTEVWVAVQSFTYVYF